MNIWFVVIAALMMAAALACVLIPLVRAGRAAGRKRAPFVLSVLMALILPPLALGLYAWVGTPRALRTTATASDQVDLPQATAQLRAKLEQSPNHPQGWLLLGQAYAAMNRPVDARDAFGRAMKLKPDDADIMVAYVEADAQVQPDHRIEDASRKLLAHAVAIDPDNQRALWLLGVSDYQQGAYTDAAAHWRHLLTLVQPSNSKIADAVKTQIVMAEARSQGKTQAQADAIAQAATAQAAASPVAVTDGTAASSTAPRTDATKPADIALKVQVRLDPKLANKVSPDETLFVYARAIDGPPMPLAATRLHASALPATVTLTDAMAMMPQLKLSSFPRVQISARISKSGNALPQAGDLEAEPVQVATNTLDAIALTIDRVR